MFNYTKEQIEDFIENGTNEQYKQLRSEFFTMKKVLDEVDKKRSERLYKLSKIKAVDELKKVPKGGLVYYCSNATSKLPYGTQMKKVRDGAKRMSVTINGKKWLVPYDRIGISKPDDATIQINRRLSNIL